MTTKNQPDTIASLSRHNFQLIVGAPLVVLVVFCFSYVQYSSGNHRSIDAAPRTKHASTKATSTLTSNYSQQAGMPTVVAPTPTNLSSTTAPSQIPDPTNTTTPQSSSNASLQGSTSSALHGNGNAQKSLLNLKISN